MKKLRTTKKLEDQRKRRALSKKSQLMTMKIPVKARIMIFLIHQKNLRKVAQLRKRKKHQRQMKSKAQKKKMMTFTSATSVTKYFLLTTNTKNTRRSAPKFQRNMYVASVQKDLPPEVI